MSHSTHLEGLVGRPFPAGPLAGALLLLAFSVTAVVFSHTTEIGTLRVEPAGVAQVRDLTFADVANGDFAVFDARTGETITVIKAGEPGFIRGAMQGMRQERRTRRVDMDAAFRLIRWDNGRLTLSDTATGQRYPLDAFGPTNSAAFARLLGEESGKP